MIPIAKPLTGEEEKQAVLRVFDSGCLAQGPEVAAFEKEFATFCDANYALATTSGTTALQLALLSLGVGHGDEVITTPFSFIASSNSILYVGAKPVFVDIEAETFNMDPKLIEAAITPKTKAILLVHLYGQSADMDHIMKIADKHNLLVIEDACQAHGATYKNKRIGSIGDAAAFSFYPTKNMTTSEGGMATFKSEKAHEKALMFRAHGMKVRYYHEVVGYNFRMTDIAAAIGREQLKKLKGFNDARKANAKYLMENIVNPKVVLPVVAKECEHVFHQFTVKIEDPNKSHPLDRDEAVDKLAELGVGTGVYYPVCINEQKCYTSEPAHNTADTPIAIETAKTVLSLPVHPALSREDLKTIVSAVNSL